MAKNIFETNVRSLLAAIRTLESKKNNEDFDGKSMEDLEEENRILKERNLCLEKKLKDVLGRMDKMRAHCQAIVSSSQGVKKIEENLEKHIPRYMEEENMALADKITNLELEVYRIGEEKQRCQEKMERQQQKLERLCELAKQTSSRVAKLEKQIVVVNETCKRFQPAAKALAKRCAALQRCQAHSRCLQEQSDSRLAEERRRVNLLETRLAMNNGRLAALQSESNGFLALGNDQRNAITYYKMRINQLETKIEELNDKLTAANEMIRDQSELLSRKLRNR